MVGFFFFFQAEDGIRDGHVTGVQTCALPISIRSRSSSSFCSGKSTWKARMSVDAWEIGRASCRERGVDLGGRRSIKKKKKRNQSSVFIKKDLIWYYEIVWSSCNSP